MTDKTKGTLQLNFVKCEYCGQSITKKRLKAHLLALHKKTLQDNTLLREKLTPEQIPLCKFCDKPVFIDHYIHETCESPDCHKALVHEHKSAQVSAQQRKLALEGRHAFNRDHAIKVNQQRITNGTHNFLANKNPELRSKAISARNKTVYSQPPYIEHYDNFNESYIRENFIHNGLLDYTSTISYFKCKDARLKKALKQWGITKLQPGRRPDLIETTLSENIPDNYLKCPWCEMCTTPASLPKHLRIAHDKTTLEYLLCILNVDDQSIPKCQICNKNNCQATIHGFLDVCDSDSCIKEHTRQLKSKATSMTHEKNILNGTHNFLKQNREYNEDGKCIMNIKGAKAAVASGKCCLLHAEHRDELFDRNFMRENFIANGYFDIEKCCDYFSISPSYAVKCKAVLDIPEPNLTCSRVAQNEIYQYILSIYHGTVTQNSRSVITNREIDIYLPDKKLAIEFDGAIFHSSGIDPWGNTRKISPTYHLQKTKLCEEQDITLLHIFEAEWLNFKKREIWKSLIKSKLGLTDKIFARKCICKKISRQQSDEFLNENHLQGTTISQYSYGLFYNDNLVAVMTFGKPRFAKGVEFELLRFCNKSGLTVIGGAGKLLKAFKKENHGNILSYANRRWSRGKLYETLGFNLVSQTNPDYYYFKLPELNLLHRTNFQKWRLKFLKNFSFNNELSESENMYSNGYMKIYDCGNLKYILKDN